jgi:hypothetical protein
MCRELRQKSKTHRNRKWVIYSDKGGYMGRLTQTKSLIVYVINCEIDVKVPNLYSKQYLKPVIYLDSYINQALLHISWWFINKRNKVWV